MFLEEGFYLEGFPAFLNELLDGDVVPLGIRTRTDPRLQRRLQRFLRYVQINHMYDNPNCMEEGGGGG